MNKAVYSYLLKTYGRQPGYWVGFVAVIIQTLLLRVVSVIVIARLAGDIADGDFQGAKSNILIYLCVAIVGLAARLVKDLSAYRAENHVYKLMMVTYYKKLVGKDMEFFRDHQTGYLASTFRQHVDSTILFVRLVRGELIQTPISLLVPTIVLFATSWKVG